jgi:hypothetical protein
MQHNKFSSRKLLLVLSRDSHYFIYFSCITRNGGPQRSATGGGCPLLSLIGMKMGCANIGSTLTRA